MKKETNQGRTKLVEEIENSSVTFMHFIDGRDISQKNRRRRRNPSGDLESKKKEVVGMYFGGFPYGKMEKIVELWVSGKKNFLYYFKKPLW